MTTEEAALGLILRDSIGAFTPGDPAFNHMTPPPDLFVNLLPDKSLTLISAEPFMGKTLILLDIALCLDHELPLWGQYNPRESKSSVFVGQDAPSHDYVRQLRKLAAGHELPTATLELSDITLLLNKDARLHDPAFDAWLRAYHDAVHFDVLLLDTLVSLIPGIDENSNTAMSAVMDRLKRWRDQLGITILFSMHTAKPAMMAPSANYRVRGATAVVASVDCHLQVTKRLTKHHITMPKGRGMTPDIPDLSLQQSHNHIRLSVERTDLPDTAQVQRWIDALRHLKHPADPAKLWPFARRAGYTRDQLDEILKRNPSHRIP